MDDLYGKGAISEIIAQKWFAKFYIWQLNFEDVINEDEIMSLMQYNPHNLTNFNVNYTVLF